jgi:hypothetical protein
MYDLGLGENKGIEETAVPEKSEDTSVNDLWEESFKAREVNDVDEVSGARVLGPKVGGGEEKNDSQLPDNPTSHPDDVTQELLKEFSGFLMKEKQTVDQKNQTFEKEVQ